MTRDFSGKAKVWIPKTQIENGNLSEWIASQKDKEIENYITTKRYMNAEVLRMTTYYKDATGRDVEVKATKKEEQYKKEREQKRQQALDKAKSERAILIAKAKENGYKVHERMKTATLEGMAKDVYRRQAEEKKKKEERKAELKKTSRFQRIAK